LTPTLEGGKEGNGNVYEEGSSQEFVGQQVDFENTIY
jgi:hypothetical protein